MPRGLKYQDYKFFEKGRQITDFLDSIYNNPQLREEVERLMVLVEKRKKVKRASAKKRKINK